MKINYLSLFKKFSIWLQAIFLPMGFWGIGILAIIDSASVPIPIDAALISFVVHDPHKSVLFVIFAALGSAIGSLLFYYMGRAGGELVLLKRINRERYEKLRDRFEKQEFLAILIPAMMPPPTPIKLFEIAAGVFEMRTFSYFSAMFLGKFVRFGVEALVTVLYGPQILAVASDAIHQHLGYVLGGVGLILIMIGVWVARKLFDRRKGTKFPVEDSLNETAAPSSGTADRES